MSNASYIGIVESLLFAAGDEGLSLKQIATVLQISEQHALEVIHQMREEYENNDMRGIKLVELASVYQLITKKKNAPYIKRLVESPGSTTLSQAALETLAIIAYKQPITKQEIEAIRGVKSDHSVNKLIEYNLVCELGRMEAPGRPILFGTTLEFLRCFGIDSIEELPAIKPEKLKDIKLAVEEEVQEELQDEIQLKLDF